MWSLTGREIANTLLGNVCCSESSPNSAHASPITWWSDGGFATAPFLHTADDLGLPVVARLKGNLPELFQAARERFSRQSPKRTFRGGRDRVEVWDADDFDPWESLRWPTVLVLYYRSISPTEM
jgi:hypothetical protein